jgi:hypothetical protein
MFEGLCGPDAHATRSPDRHLGEAEERRDREEGEPDERAFAALVAAAPDSAVRDLPRPGRAADLAGIVRRWLHCVG